MTAPERKKHLQVYASDITCGFDVYLHTNDFFLNYNVDSTKGGKIRTVLDKLKGEVHLITLYNPTLLQFGVLLWTFL